VDSHFFFSIFNGRSLIKSAFRLTSLVFLACIEFGILGAFIYAEYDTDEATDVYDGDILDKYYINDALLPLAAVVLLQPIFGFVHWSMYTSNREVLSILLMTILGIIGIVVTAVMVEEFCCEYSAIWTVGGILLMVYEILGLETLIALFITFSEYKYKDRD
jgi:hypothetical protein